MLVCLVDFRSAFDSIICESHCTVVQSHGIFDRLLRLLRDTTGELLARQSVIWGTVFEFNTYCRSPTRLSSSTDALFNHTVDCTMNPSVTNYPNILLGWRKTSRIWGSWMTILLGNSTDAFQPTLCWPTLFLEVHRTRNVHKCSIVNRQS